MDPQKQVQLGDDPIPFQNSWCFWFDRFNGTGKTVTEYESNLQVVCSFSTVQRFWECFNNLPTPDNLSIKSSLHMMVEGVKPLWEDPKNETGGFWSLRLKASDSSEVWRELVLAVIGEQFSPELEEGDDINGVTVSIRANCHVVQVWNRKASETSKETILRKIKKLLPNVTIEAIFYKECKSHADFGRQ
eukprot:TRINITY_DN3630_c0_g1_i1.p1 TRINITY_DN3630_c0_g1~~TRINITY_DN3630_c0_g1_i1.p1  ORF type:complete len:189 (+),score=40.27 TRINITY_DN3630_c0_g1_i1:55-621(+)